MSLTLKRHWLSRIAAAEGALLIVLGTAVMVGWYADLPALVQIRPEFVPMQYNTALGFLLMGGALICLVGGRGRVASMLGVLVATIGLLTLTQYVFLVDFGIDELVMEHYITVATSHPGRMAPNTALSFLLGGVGIAAAVHLRSGKLVDWILGLSGSVVAGLGLIAILGYWSGVTTAYGWANLTKMAVHTSVGFVLAGSAMTMR
ncbi:hypothetical protein JYT20_01735, partial [Rhodothermus sp. AH-315-K08]|nr:hypothetical protein [Rhodothermus sp. AH-315-K08]